MRSNRPYTEETKEFRTTEACLYIELDNIKTEMAALEAKRVRTLEAIVDLYRKD